MFVFGFEPRLCPVSICFPASNLKWLCKTDYIYHVISLIKIWKYTLAHDEAEIRYLKKWLGNSAVAITCLINKNILNPSNKKNDDPLYTGLHLFLLFLVCFSCGQQYRFQIRVWTKVTTNEYHMCLNIRVLMTWPLVCDGFWLHVFLLVSKSILLLNVSWNCLKSTWSVGPRVFGRSLIVNLKWEWIIVTNE